MVDNNNNSNNCYICMEKIKNPIYPAGCTHGFCKIHLKVNKLIIIIFNLI